MFIGKKFANKVMGLRVNQSKITENAKYKFVNLTVTWVAQLRECWSADQEVAGLNPQARPTLRDSKELRSSAFIM